MVVILERRTVKGLGVKTVKKKKGEIVEILFTQQTHRHTLLNPSVHSDLSTLDKERVETIDFSSFQTIGIRGIVIDTVILLFPIKKTSGV